MLIFKLFGGRFYIRQWFQSAIRGCVHMEQSKLLLMAILARRLLKMLLFIGLFWLSIRYIHTSYSTPLLENQWSFWIGISEKIQIFNVEETYFLVMIILELLTTIIVYKLILKLCRLMPAKCQTNSS